MGEDCLHTFERRLIRDDDSQSALEPCGQGIFYFDVDCFLSFCWIFLARKRGTNIGCKVASHFLFSESRLTPEILDLNIELIIYIVSLEYPALQSVLRFKISSEAGGHNGDGIWRSIRHPLDGNLLHLHRIYLQ